MAHKQMNVGRYVLLHLGNQFAAGKLVRSNPYMVTLEVYRGNRKFRPGYSRDTIRRILPINKKMAEILGPFSYPDDPFLGPGQS